MKSSKPPHVSREFLKAFDDYQLHLVQHGENHPLTQQSFTLMLEHMPESMKQEIDAKAKELGLLPPPSGYTDDGEPMYRLEDVAKHLGMSIEDAEQRLLELLDNRQ